MSREASKRGKEIKLDGLFRDGGAFPQYPFLQFPRGIGRQAVIPPAFFQASKAKTLELKRTTVPNARSNGSASHAVDPVKALLITEKSGTSPSTLEGISSNPVGSGAIPSLSSVGQGALAVVREAQGREQVAEAKRGEEERANAEATQLSLQQKLRSHAGVTRNGAASDLPPALVTRQQKPSASAGSSLALFAAPPAPGGGPDGEGPVVRSPTKSKKSNVWQQRVAVSEGGDATERKAEAADAEADLFVPAHISAWRNKKKLIVPIQERIALETDERTDTSTTMGSHLIDLANTMFHAQKEVQREQEAKLAAQLEHQRRQQAEVEAVEAHKAQKILEAKAAAMAQQQQRKETRAERLERIRLEQDLRQREKKEVQRRKRLERIAENLHMTVEELEANQNHLREETGGPAASATVVSSLAGAAPNASLAEAPAEDEEDEGGRGVAGRRREYLQPVVTAGAGVTNSGIRKEMDHLAQRAPATLHAENREVVAGIGSGSDDDEASEEEEDFAHLRKKRRVRL